MLDLINEVNLSRDLFASFDKRDQDGDHDLRFAFGGGAGATANLDVGIGGLLKGQDAPPDDSENPFILNPRATVVTVDGESTITYAKDHGIVTIKQRGGGVVLQCPLRDAIVIVVDRT